ncbi:unnamed protein product [Tilletia controversa]|uniref:FAD dependent oxidoreductase domain-containing protein n=1 Tax=Tilletia controversa TaxID=13291 RepID=A0A8X7SW41_9BASI|nr:hypothetical protein CF328_g4355 [Tilletia controversa]KAE8246129.1 hypothetical protein A4X06_0g5168 [Tilletia controversa]CAD6914436.1 unnamed protein product [Tilletia controversa]CAD6933380.1 unnamed protein product [Tilletia controversa]CAD6938912.1 unnamed protein product [Tilletia controversa]
MASFLIIGAGVFGASTALHLKKHLPNATVTILERSSSERNNNDAQEAGPHPAPASDAASSDLNKIIRADYADEHFRRLGVDAIAHWRTDERLRPFYHEVGLLLHSLPYPSAAGPSGSEGGVNAALDAAWAIAKKGVEEAARVAREDSRLVTNGDGDGDEGLPALAHLCQTRDDLEKAVPQEARACLGHCLEAIGGHRPPASLDGPDGPQDKVEEGATVAAYFNPRAGWAEAKEATCAVLRHALELGVRIESGAEVVELLTSGGEEGGSLIRGVKTADGRQFEIDPSAGAVFLCGGSWTPSLLQSLIPSSISTTLPPPVVFSAQTVLIVEIPEEVALRHDKIPVVLNYDTGFYCFEPRKMVVEGGEGGGGGGIADTRWLVKCAIHDRGYQAPFPPSASSATTQSAYPGFESAFAQKGEEEEEEGNDAQPRSELASTSARGYIPADHQDRMMLALRTIWPELAERGKVHQSRICWYAETTDENWLIDSHPLFANLIVASGDSGHGFKFLPTIGALIAARLPTALRPTTLPPLDEHWDKVFSWAHHEERFRAARAQHQSGGTRQPRAEWKADRDSASKVVALEDGGADGAGHLVAWEQDTSRGL